MLRSKLNRDQLGKVGNKVEAAAAFNNYPIRAIVKTKRSGLCRPRGKLQFAMIAVLADHHMAGVNASMSRLTRA